MPRFLDELRSGVMLGDGAMGTLLYQRGVPLDACYDALNLENPSLITRIHAEYVGAGARLIETNTFGANRLKLAKFGLEREVRKLNEAGAALAVSAGHEVGAYVAGSVGPLSTNAAATVQSAVQSSCYAEQIEALVAGGVDAIFLETFSRTAELVLAVTAARAICDLPIIASLSFSDDGHTADGLRINAAFEQLRAAHAHVTGVNCHTGPVGILRLLEELFVRPGDLISAYPNAGRPEFYEGRYLYHPTAQYFADNVPSLIAQGARLIGGCCGTTPETIRAMAPRLAGQLPVSSKRGKVLVESALARRASTPGPRALLSSHPEQPLIVTELDPPKGLDMAKMLEGARALKEAGTDFLTLADNSLAILRVSNWAAAHLVRERVGIEPILHLACRDRNLLGLQSELMGIHALGLHNVLALTGDPSKVGDHPGSTSVYDVNSVGLIRMIKRLNEGFAANGRDLKDRTRFVIGCAFNPNARNLDSQIRKLEDKIAAGAQFVMTQPVFDPALVKETFTRTQPLGIPVLVGVMPLLSSKNAEYLHNEVPGIVIPDPIRDRLRNQDTAGALAAGLTIARELAECVLESFTGIYLITPFMRFDVTANLTQHIRAQHLGRPAAATPLVRS